MAKYIWESSLLNSFITTEQPRVCGFGSVSAVLGVELSA